MAEIFRPPFLQVETAGGVPISGAKLYFYQAESTTDLTVYQDIDLTIPHQQPVEASASGIFPAIYVGANTYKAVLKDANGVTIATFDNINGTATGNVVLDGSFRIQNTSDNTKQVAFSAAGITAGTTRTLVVPDASGTIALVADLQDGDNAATSDQYGVVKIATINDAWAATDAAKALSSASMIRHTRAAKSYIFNTYGAFR